MEEIDLRGSKVEKEQVIWEGELFCLSTNSDHFSMMEINYKLHNPDWVYEIIKKNHRPWGKKKSLLSSCNMKFLVFFPHRGELNTKD